MNNVVFDINLFLQWVEEQIYERPESVPNLLELMKLANSANDTRVLDIAETFETHLMTAAAKEFEETLIGASVDKLFHMPTEEARKFLETAEGYEFSNFAHPKIPTPQSFRLQAIITWKQMGNLKSRDNSWYNPTCYMVSAKNLAKSWYGVGEQWGKAFNAICKNVLYQRKNND